MNPSTIFNSSILSIHIPNKPLNNNNKIPNSTKNDNELNELELKELNDWVNLIINLEEREEAFYGKLKFRIK